MKSVKTVLILASVLVIITSAFFFYQYYKPERNIASERPLLLTAEDLFQKFSSNEQQANQLYLNKVVQVTGNVLDIKHTNQGEDVIVLKSSDPMFGTCCTLASSQTLHAKLNQGDKVTIKGICTGYLTDVVLIRSFLVN